MAKPPPPKTPETAPFRQLVAGMIAIPAVYIYFLIFAEFAFIEHLRSVVHETGIAFLMAALDLSGIGGSFAAATWFSQNKGTSQLAAGFIGCALA